MEVDALRSLTKKVVELDATEIKRMFCPTASMLSRRAQRVAYGGKERDRRQLSEDTERSPRCICDNAVERAEQKAGLNLTQPFYVKEMRMGSYRDFPRKREVHTENYSGK
jgi:hypothetical protein